MQPGINVLDYRKKEKQRMGPYIVVGVRARKVYVDCNGEENHINVCQVAPMPQTQGNRALKWLLEGMEQFKSDPPPEVFATKKHKSLRSEKMIRIV